MKRYRLNLNLTGVIMLVALGVLLPVMLATAVGIVSIVIAHDVGGIVTGVLMISFAMAAAGSALITVVLTGRKARLARRQADFVATVSHEFRTPLSAIKLYAQTLQSDEVAANREHRTQCLNTILRDAEWLDLMVDKVLTWRASSKDAMQLNMKQEPVAQAINSAIERFKLMVNTEEITFSSSLDSKTPVDHDHTALNTVILNLLTNAYKYTGKNKKISVRAYDTNQSVIIQVEDNGYGMRPAEVKHVFQPFYRGSSDKSNTSGVGLGLAITKYLVNQHNGTIDIRSSEGKGSTFTITLPVTGQKK